MAQAHKRITRVNPPNLPSLKPRVPRCFFPSRESRSRSSRQDGIPTPHESPLIRSQIHGAIVHLDRPALLQSRVGRRFSHRILDPQASRPLLAQK